MFSRTSNIVFCINCIFFVMVSTFAFASTSVAEANTDSGEVTAVTPVTESNYGERLADSSYVFNSVVSRGHDIAKDETYSSGINAILNSDGFLNSMTKLSGGESKYTPSGPVEAAIQSKKTIEVIPVRFDEPTKDGEPQVIEISPYEVPLSIVFKTQTNKINVNQEHKSEIPEEVKETNSEEEPHRVVHNVYRPVIQEVTEIVQPYRKVLQKVEPVIEQMKTIITKASPDGRSGEPIAPRSEFPSYEAKSNTNSMQISKSGGDSRYGGNDFARGLNIIPLAYGSEVIKKLSSPPYSNPSVNENEISRRYGFSNRSRVDENYMDKKGLTNNKPDYNSIINDYISKFLEPKPASSKQSTQSINPNSIKMFNVPMKQGPNSLKSSRSNKAAFTSALPPTATEEKPRFKIIKEFRVTLDDLKKLKLAPFVLANKGIDGMRTFALNGRPDDAFFGNGGNQHRAESNSVPRFRAPNSFSMQLNANSFRPMSMMNGGGAANLKRMGDTYSRREPTSGRLRNSFQRRQLRFADYRSPSYSPFHASRMIERRNSAADESSQIQSTEAAATNSPFRRSPEDRTFFENKRFL